MVFVWLFFITMLSMISGICLPDRLWNRWPRPAIHLMTGQTLLTLFSVLGMVFQKSWLHTPHTLTFLHVNGHHLGFYLDGLSLVLLCLVSLMVTLIGRFSIRYLDGDPQQGRFMKWLLFTAATVMLFISSNHVALFMGAWISSSLGLHQLLLHYQHRPQARLAARKKFMVSRLGDVALLMAFALIVRHFHHWHYADIFAQMNQTTFTPSLQIASFLLVLGAMTKSAQFPIHSWLPETLETPTPVSALMHAGIINAGGFLILRWSPLLVHYPLALLTLAWVGGFTALFAVLVMLTQTSIKKRLAYSTISQMGLMMLQCGLGAFTAAALHIVVHSLYKAHAFLNAGSILQHMQQARLRKSGPPRSLGNLALVGVALLMAGVSSLAAWCLHIPLWSKSGGLILLSLLSLGCTALAVHSYEHSRRLFYFTPLLSFAMSYLYFLLHHSFDSFLSPIFPKLHLPRPLEIALGLLLVLGFWGILLLERNLRRSAPSDHLHRLYILIRNEFYADIYLKRLSGWEFVPKRTRHKSPKGAKSSP